jgi:hypothetical protein
MQQENQMNQPDRELLIRMDERQQSLLQSISELKLMLVNKVDNGPEYKELVAQNKVMWDLKNKAAGYIATITIAIGIVVTLVTNWLVKVLFK